ncbi:MAG: hypothetical protein OSB05_05415 [Akkermansiaceae bacterium]|nr:hypothetical protein [Akkermansiaceae bacterium]
MGHRMVFDRGTRDDEIKGGSLGGEDRWGLQEMVSDEVYCADRRSSFMDAGVVNRDELCQVIDNLPENHSRKAEVLMEKAGVMGWREGKVTEVEKIYAEARELAHTQKTQRVVHLADALHARVLGQKPRISESWKFGQRVDPKHLPEADQKWFGNDLKTWKEAAAKSLLNRSKS